MLKRKWYRRLRVLFGARSFVKKDTRALISGSWTPDVINALRESGFTEEWEKFPDGAGT